MALKSLVRGAASVGLLLGTALVVPSCGDDDDDGDSPEELCNEFADAFCEVVFECVPAEARTAAQLDSLSECKTQYRAQLECRTLRDEEPCEGTGTYDPAGARQCVEELRTISCIDFLATQDPSDLSATCDKTCIDEP